MTHDQRWDTPTGYCTDHGAYDPSGDCPGCVPVVYKVGDVVQLGGASAFVGDVVAVDDEDEDAQQVTVAWRPVTTTELADDLEPGP